jgi:tRNA pseudouridine55 synthase
MKHGLLLIDKQPGGTSHDVVQEVRRLFRQKKVGHCGTLDPDATGLLLLTVGQATRLTRFLIRAPKVYRGTIRFGISTDTYDAAGTVTAERPLDDLTRERVESAMSELVGTFEQLVPSYSAKKVKGVKHYELARRGEEVPRETKTVTIYELEATGDLEDGRLPFRLACSSGTYARTVAHDVGEAVGTGGHLALLRRHQVGSFRVEDAIAVEELRSRYDAARDGSGEEPDPTVLAGSAWVPFDDIPLPFGEVVTDAQQERRIDHGQTVLLRELPGEEGDWVKLVNPRRQFIAVGTVVERIGTGGAGIVQPRVVFKGT